MKAALLISLLGVFLLAGCLSGYEKTTSKNEVSAQQPAVSTEEQTIQEVENISTEVEEIANIEEELNTSELDQIDFDLGI